MAQLTAVWTWIQANWVTLVGLGWLIEKALEMIGTMTGNKMIDNLGTWLATMLNKVGNKPTI